jgi:hypothetical protein
MWSQRSKKKRTLRNTDDPLKMWEFPRPVVSIVGISHDIEESAAFPYVSPFHFAFFEQYIQVEKKPYLRTPYL